MKIELWYDAVAQETDILINSVPVEKNDAYGFLYPVRNYPLQSWIYPNGSWKGLEFQIRDLSRDEEVDLIIHGRKCDYDDVHNCLLPCPIIHPQFIEWDVCNRYDTLFSKLLSTLKSNDAVMRRLLSSLNANFHYQTDFDTFISNSNWAYDIYSDEDFAKADEKIEKHCCFVHDSFFTSYDKLQNLLSLTRSLLIPADAIYCCFDTEQKKEDYRYYAQSFKRMGFRFCLEDTAYEEEARCKYGLPAIVKMKMQKCGEISDSLSAAYLEMKESTEVEFVRLTHNIVHLSPAENRRYQTMKNLRDNAFKFRHGMELITKYINILLSISKENKEEVFHYACIDKLDENINTYLNANSLCEVR